jgi:hypothetical protein
MKPKQESTLNGEPRRHKTRPPPALKADALPEGLSSVTEQMAKERHA